MKIFSFFLAFLVSVFAFTSPINSSATPPQPAQVAVEASQPTQVKQKNNKPLSVLVNVFRVFIIIPLILTCTVIAGVMGNIFGWRVSACIGAGVGILASLIFFEAEKMFLLAFCGFIVAMAVFVVLRLESIRDAVRIKNAESQKR